LLPRNRGRARRRRRSGDLRQEGIDAAEDPLLIPTGELVQALQAAKESAVRRPTGAVCRARRGEAEELVG